jgi:hypothetical protein
MEFFTNLHSLLSFYRLVQTASQNFLLLFSFSLTSSSHAGLPAPLIQGLGPDFCARKQVYVSYRIVLAAGGSAEQTVTDTTPASDSSAAALAVVVRSEAATQTEERKKEEDTATQTLPLCRDTSPFARLPSGLATTLGDFCKCVITNKIQYIVIVLFLLKSMNSGVRFGN